MSRRAPRTWRRVAAQAFTIGALAITLVTMTAGVITIIDALLLYLTPTSREAPWMPKKCAPFST